VVSAVNKKNLILKKYKHKILKSGTIKREKALTIGMAEAGSEVRMRDKHN
jgi:hypothetical protein